MVVNPKVSYSPKTLRGKGSIDGVAVWLKGLMDVLDEFGIDHPCENEL